ncbi:hypothetical protein niasHS_012744 [Heterodera schachtii]|uniref:Uncharacterized protein n=1 Tax=Heterodera schachtii TaxID=97005 RepID=A0ABD2IGY9_HETSC
MAAPIVAESYSSAKQQQRTEFNYQQKLQSTKPINNEHSTPSLTFIEQIGRMELVQSIVQFMEKIGFGTGENNKKKKQRIERRSATNKNLKEQHREIFGRMNHFDNTMTTFVRSPSIRRPSFANDPPITSSIDARPMTIAKEQRRTETPKLNEMPPPSFHEAIGKEWKHALFGRGGLLTEVFNFVNDKRKEDLAKKQAAPNLNDKASREFSQILDALLRKAKSGNFDEEPLPEIPFIGICNRLSCADIYKALDQFRKSEFFSNFQTAISLLQDPKGLDMIGELLANPDLIENFSGPESLGEMFGSKKAQKSGTSRVEIGENMDGENIGIDFSSQIDGQNNTTNVHPPQIASSIDSGAPDYYNFAEQKIGNAEKVDKIQKNKIEFTKPKVESEKKVQSSTQTKIDFNRELPEIAEAIDSVPEEEEFPGGDMLVFEKNEWLPSASANDTKKQFVLTPVFGRTHEKKKTEPSTTVTVQQQLRNTKNKIGQSQGTTTAKSSQQKRVKEGSGSTAGADDQNATSQIIKIGDNKLPKIATAAKLVTMPTITATTTRRNFRRNDDYYSMYYDGESG